MVVTRTAPCVVIFITSWLDWKIWVGNRPVVACLVSQAAGRIERRSPLIIERLQDVVLIIVIIPIKVGVVDACPSGETVIGLFLLNSPVKRSVTTGVSGEPWPPLYL